MYQVKVEKVISKPANDIFEALKQGLLFMNCGANSGTMQIDFRVGGKYHIDFKNKTLENFGEFLEIVPNRKVVFSWCQNFGADQKPDSQVTIELFEDGPKTRLVILHTGFKTEEIKNAHQGGWNDGVNDFTNQILDGKIRILRGYEVPAEKLYEICKNPKTFSSLKGDYKVLETVPNHKIKLSDSITLTINQKDSRTSSVEIIHEGLKSLADQKAQRSNWEEVTKKIKETLT